MVFTAEVRMQKFIIIKNGDYLLSHPVAQAVPSAFRGLTSLFGMGRGVTPWL